MHGLYWAMAVAVGATHGAFVAFVVLGGLLTPRHPRLAPFHIAAAGWGVAGLLVPLACPLTGLENLLRRDAGHPTLPAGFIDHYLTGVIYPERLTPLAQLIVAASLLTSVAVLVRTRRGPTRSGDAGRWRPRRQA
jgi:Protein of Unknown function (DUF2784)